MRDIEVAVTLRGGCIGVPSYLLHICIYVLRLSIVITYLLLYLLL